MGRTYVPHSCKRRQVLSGIPDRIEVSPGRTQRSGDLVPQPAHETVPQTVSNRTHRNVPVARTERRTTMQHGMHTTIDLQRWNNSYATASSSTTIWLPTSGCAGHTRAWQPASSKACGRSWRPVRSLPGSPGSSSLGAVHRAALPLLSCFRRTRSAHFLSHRCGPPPSFPPRRAPARDGRRKGWYERPLPTLNFPIPNIRS